MNESNRIQREIGLFKLKIIAWTRNVCYYLITKSIFIKGGINEG